MVELVTELKSKGYDSNLPIILYEGKILDGWNRYNACIQAQVQPAFREFTGPREEALLYTIRTNKRRELNPGQKAVIADKYRPLLEKEAAARKTEALKQNQAEPTPKDAKTEKKKGSVNKLLSEQFDVSETNLKKVNRPKKEDPKLLDQVESGKISLNKADKELNKKKQTKKIEKALPKQKSDAKKAIKDLSKEQGVYKNSPNDWKIVSNTLAVHLDMSDSFLDEFDKFIPNPGKEFLVVWKKYRDSIKELRSWCADKATKCNHCHGTFSMYIDENGIPTSKELGKPVTCPYCMQGLSGS